MGMDFNSCTRDEIFTFLCLAWVFSFVKNNTVYPCGLVMFEKLRAGATLSLSGCGLRQAGAWKPSELEIDPCAIPCFAVKWIPPDRLRGQICGLVRWRNPHSLPLPNSLKVHLPGPWCRSRLQLLNMVPWGRIFSGQDPTMAQLVSFLVSLYQPTKGSLKRSEDTTILIGFPQKKTRYAPNITRKHWLSKQ